MEYKILISDRSFNALQDITGLAENIRWEYTAEGGCGAFGFDLPIDFCRERFLGGSFNVKIYRRDPTDGTYALWFQGRIENKIHNVRGHQESIKVQGSGYQSELKDIYVDRNYSSQAIDAIVKDILDNDVTPNTNVTYSAGDIESTGFTADSLEFNTDALSAMKTLADIVNFEWGVDKDRKFYFKNRSSTVSFRFPLGAKVINWSGDSSSKDIVNRVIVIGGETGGSPFTATYNDTQSQLKWNRRDKVINNSAIVTSSVASQFADAVFADSNDVVRRGRLQLLDEQLIETSTPIPLVQVIPKGDTYGTRKYGTGLYNALIDYRIQRINYKIDDSGNLTIDLQIGQLRPSIAEDISRLEFQIDQVRQRGV